MSSQKTGRYFALASALALIVAATLTPDPTDPWTRHFWCWRCSNDAPVIEFALNIALFIPLGVSLRVVGVRLSRVVMAAMIATVAIEAAQYFLVPGRDASIRDCVANTIGGAAGFLMLAPLTTLVNPSATAARRIAIGAAALWTLHAVFAMEAFRPAATPSQLFVQIAPRLEQYDVFPGRVGAVMVNGAAAFDGPLPPGFTAEALIDQPLELSVPIRPKGATRRYAPIVALVDANTNEIAELGQRRTDLVFYTYVRADVWGFWAPKLVVANALADTTALAISAKRDGYALSASVRAPSGASHGLLLVLRPAVGWWLWWPFTIPAAWVIAMLTGVWLAVAFALIGYWSARGWWAPKLYLSERLPALAPIIVAAGLAHVAVPLAFRAPSLGGGSDVAAVVIGAVIGLALGGLRKSGSGP